MRFAWTVVGDDPDFNQGNKYGIDGYFYPMFDSLTTPERLRDTQARGYVIGIYLGHNWLPGKSPAEIASTVSAEFKRLTTKPGVAVKNLRVQLNFEEHDPVLILERLQAWRALRPTVGTSWSMEGMQGGWMGPVVTPTTPASDFVRDVLAQRVRLVPQTFTGDMRRQESAEVLRDLIQRGFPENIISPFYDAAQLGLEWDGYAFTMGRLPYIP